MSKDKIKVEGAMSIGELVTYLEDVVAGLRAGSVCMSVGQDCLTLKPRGVMEVSIKVGQKKDKEKLALEVEWARSEEASMRIGSGQ